MTFHLIIDLVCKTKASVIHRQQESLYLQLGVQFAFDNLYRVQQLADSLKCEILTLHGYYHGVGCRQRIHRNQSQRRRTVDQDIIVVVPYRLEHSLYHLFAMVKVQHLNLRSYEVDMARYDIQAFDVCCINGVSHVSMIDDAFIKRAVNVF